MILKHLILILIMISTLLFFYKIQYLSLYICVCVGIFKKNLKITLKLKYIQILYTVKQHIILQRYLRALNHFFFIFLAFKVRK